MRTAEAYHGLFANKQCLIPNAEVTVSYCGAALCVLDIVDVCASEICRGCPRPIAPVIGSDALVGHPGYNKIGAHDGGIVIEDIECRTTDQGQTHEPNEGS